MAALFISHDMAVVERISHRVALMFWGKLVEIGTRQEIFETPARPIPDTFSPLYRLTLL